MKGDLGGIPGWLARDRPALHVKVISHFVSAAPGKQFQLAKIGAVDNRGFCLNAPPYPQQLSFHVPQGRADQLDAVAILRTRDVALHFKVARERFLVLLQ